jgi:two-component system sensor histidine kinase CpxA
MFGRIYLKLYLSFLVIFLITMVIVILLSSFFYQRNLRNELHGIFLSHARFLADEYGRQCGSSNHLDNDSCRSFFNNLSKLEGVRLWIVNPKGEIILSDENIPLETDPDELRKAAETGDLILHRRHASPRIIVQIPNLTESQRRYLVLESSFKGRRHIPRFSFLTTMILVGSVVALLILPLSLRITRPLRQLHSLASEWAEGRLDRRAQIRGKDEIAQLGSVFNIMAENLQRTLEQRKEFLALISHELKSPLARMRIALELLAEKHEGQSEMTEIINGINTEISESEKLIDQLLVLSKVEMTLPSTIREPFDLNTTVKSALDHVIPLAQPKRIAIDSQLNVVPKVQGDSSQIQRALVNVMENAIKFSPESSEILVKLDAASQAVELLIADQGPGIPAEERERIFQPFYRVNEENQQQGSGLGLYIARKIIELHGGKIEAGANEPNGTIIKILLPIHLS